jgi:hypothetical protein
MGGPEIIYFASVLILYSLNNSYNFHNSKQLYLKSISNNQYQTEIFNAIYIPITHLSAQGTRQAMTQGQVSGAEDAGDKQE